MQHIILDLPTNAQMRPAAGRGDLRSAERRGRETRAERCRVYHRTALSSTSFSIFPPDAQ
jgi:hypothetical protein